MEGNGETRPYSRPTTHPLDIPNFVSSSGLAMQQQQQQRQQLSPSPSPEAASKRLGMPPSHPNNPTRPTWQHQTSSVSPAAAGGGSSSSSHTRSLSQPSFFSLDSLPPLSPSLTYREQQPSLSDPSNSVDVSMEDTHSSNPFWGGGGDGIPPRRGHRRSSSDVPLGFSAVIQSSPQLIPIGRRASFDGKESSSDNNKAEIVDDLFSAYMNLDNIDKMSSPGGCGGGEDNNNNNNNNKDLDSRFSGGLKTNGGESSDNEVESGLNVKREGMKRSAGGNLTRTVRHCRSVSMDSYMDNLNFDEELLKPLPLGGQVGQQSPGGNSVDGNSGKFSMEFGSGEFNAIELKKIMESEKLSEIAVSDPKRAKRILANRQSAARSKERKMRYIVELEHKVQTLQTEATTLSAQVTKLQRDSMGLTSENNELKFRLQALEQQAQLKDALNEALTGEVQRLRITAAELGGEGNLSNRMSQQHLLNQQMLQLQQLNLYQMQQQPQHQSQQQQQIMQQQQQQQPQQNRSPSHQQNGNAAPKHESFQ